MGVGVAAVVVASALLVLFVGRALAVRKQVTRLDGALADAFADRLRRHREQMSQLQRTVALLEYDAVADAAHAIQDEPPIARPEEDAPSEDPRASFPPAFFELQDVLHAHVRELGLAARARDDRRLGQAYGRIAETCVRCHALFRQVR
ncbi:MAG: cytochrome c [Myxococcaceae bacterium]|nr:cytochrome c [Myxococcaceae bacterium]